MQPNRLRITVRKTRADLSTAAHEELVQKKTKKNAVPLGSTAVNAPLTAGRGVQVSPMRSMPPETTATSPAAPMMQLGAAVIRGAAVFAVPLSFAVRHRLAQEVGPAFQRDHGAATPRWGQRRSAAAAADAGGASRTRSSARETERGRKGAERCGHSAVCPVVAVGRVHDDLTAGEHVRPHRERRRPLRRADHVAVGPELEPVKYLGLGAGRDGGGVLERKLPQCAVRLDIGAGGPG